MVQTLWPEIGLKRAGEMSFKNTQMANREGVPFQSLTGRRVPNVEREYPPHPGNRRSRKRDNR